MEDYNGPELEYHDLERLHSDNPNEPPKYRERDPDEYVDVLASMIRGSGSGSLASTASPGLGPSSPRFRARTTSRSSNQSAHQPHSRLHHGLGLTEDDFGIEPPQFRISENDERHRDGSAAVEEEDFGVGEAVS